MRKRIKSYYPFIPLLLVSIFYIIKAADFPVHDFANYYFGGKFLADGTFNQQIYFPYLFNKNIADLGYSEIFVSYAPNTPFLALFFLPFGFLPLATAKLIFNCISLLLLLYGLRRLVRFYKIKTSYLFLIPLIFLIPIKNNLLFGQVYFLLFFLIAESLLAYEKKQFITMGLLLSLAVFLKVFPILILLVFIARKEFKPLLYTVGSCLLFFGISVIISGFGIWVFYLESVLSKASNGEIATAYVDNYQSVFMFLKRLLVCNAYENPKAFFHHPVLFKTLILGFKIALVSIGYFICKKISNPLHVFAYLILASILISPYGSTYTLILLVFVYLQLAKMEIPITKKILFIGVLFLICNMPLTGFLTNVFPFSYLRLLFLILLFTFLLILDGTSIPWKWVSVIALVPAVIFAFSTKETPESSKPFLHTQGPILVYDYQISNQKLTYYYWNSKGKNQRSIQLCVSDHVPLKISNNQIFYNKKQLTFDKNNKLKPILLNDEAVLYLTDHQKGIGFYSLRILPVN